MYHTQKIEEDVIHVSDTSDSQRTRVENEQKNLSLKSWHFWLAALLIMLTLARFLNFPRVEDTSLEKHMISEVRSDMIRPPGPCALHNKDGKTRDRRCEGCTSQTDQDVILRRIFDVIGTTNKQCVEFGFGYGGRKVQNLTMADLVGDDSGNVSMIMSGLNTQALLKAGWKGVFFDADISNPNINLVKSVLTAENIGQAFQDAGILFEVDYVSIDVDSIDVWLFHGLLSGGYRPRVVSVEYNSNFPPQMLLACEKKWAPWRGGSRVYGSSASSINMVAEIFGYQVVEIQKNLDMFFVRKDVLHSKCTADSLPSYKTLAEGFVGQPCHRWCNAALAERLVDFPLALIGLEKEAKKKAMTDVRELNLINTARGLEPFCNIDS